MLSAATALFQLQCNISPGQAFNHIKKYPDCKPFQNYSWRVLIDNPTLLYCNRKIYQIISPKMIYFTEFIHLCTPKCLQLSTEIIIIKLHNIELLNIVWFSHTINYILVLLFLSTSPHTSSELCCLLNNKRNVILYRLINIPLIEWRVPVSEHYTMNTIHYSLQKVQ